MEIVICDYLYYYYICDYFMRSEEISVCINLHLLVWILLLQARSVAKVFLNDDYVLRS